MNVLTSIRKPYTDLIFNGTKPLEFRTRIPTDLEPDDTIFIYESKFKGGAGKVIGEAKLKQSLEIPKERLGMSFLLPYYADLFCSKEDQEQIQRFLPIKVSHFNRGLIIDELFNVALTNALLKHGALVGYKTYKNLKELYPKSKIQQDKAEALIRSCDEWGRTIGYYNKWDVVHWDYALELYDVKKYPVSKDLSEFEGRQGPIKQAPQSFCYIAKMKGR